MEGLGLIIVVVIVMGFTTYGQIRDRHRWNSGVCKETQQPWTWTGGISPMGYYCYYGGAINGESQFIWIEKQ